MRGWAGRSESIMDVEQHTRIEQIRPLTDTTSWKSPIRVGALASPFVSRRPLQLVGIVVYSVHLQRQDAHSSDSAVTKGKGTAPAVDD